MKTLEKNEKKFANIAGIKIRYRVRGEGFPLIFVHGLLGCIEQEDVMAGEKARLTEKYKVIHYDGRGRGQSEAGGYDIKNYTWEALADDLWALMQHLGIERAHFIGGSQGSSVALWLAIHRPEAVAGLVLHNPVVVSGHEKEYIDGILDYAEFIEREGMDAVTDLILNIPPNDQLRITHPHIIEFYDQVMRSQNSRVVSVATKGLVCSTPIKEEQLSSITVPTLIISSDGDGLHPSNFGRFLADQIQDSRTLFGPTATYFTDNPDKVPRRILQFFSEVDGVNWD